MEFSSTVFGETNDLSMEGAVVIFKRKVGDELKEIMRFHSFLSDNNRQDSRTTFANRCQMIKDLRKSDPTILPPGLTMYELMDGCSKQYRICCT